MLARPLYTDRPVALDLFCGAGGASLGLLAAGFEVHGVDLDFRRRDGTLRNPIIHIGVARDVTTLTPDDLRGYDFIWASPPCQAFSVARRLHKNARPAPNLIPATRQLIHDSGVPGVIENVPNAPLRKDVILTGPKVGEPSMIRQRIFEFINLPPPKGVNDDLCERDPDIVSLAGNSTPRAPNPSRGYRKFESLPRPAQLAWKQRCIGAPWMEWHECNQAVPARYAYAIAVTALWQIRLQRKGIA